MKLGNITDSNADTTKVKDLDTEMQSKDYIPFNHCGEWEVNNNMRNREWSDPIYLETADYETI